MTNKLHHCLIAWQCTKCHWLTISDSRERHQMDLCHCEETSLDLELEYARMTGSYEPLLINQLDHKGWKRVPKKRKLE